MGTKLLFPSWAIESTTQPPKQMRLFQNAVSAAFWLLRTFFRFSDAPFLWGFSGAGKGLIRPDSMPNPDQAVPTPFTHDPFAFLGFRMGISGFTNLELEDIERLHAHSKVRYDNTIQSLPHGIEPMGEPLEPFDGPVIGHVFKQALVAGVMCHLDVPRVIKKGIETLVVSLVVHGQDTPQ